MEGGGDPPVAAAEAANTTKFSEGGLPPYDEVEDDDNNNGPNSENEPLLGGTRPRRSSLRESGERRRSLGHRVRFSDGGMSPSDDNRDGVVSSLDGHVHSPTPDSHDDHHPRWRSSWFWQEKMTHALESAKTMKKRSRYYIPSMMWLPDYDWRGDLVPDIVAALTLTTLLVPQGIAYSDLAGVPSIHGLYTAAYPPLIYAFLTTSKQCSVGPEATVALMVGGAVSGGIEERASQAALIAIFAGAILLLLGLLRLGFIDSMFSRILLHGFILAVAIIIMLEQLPSLLGISLNEHTSTPLATIIAICKVLGDANWKTSVISICSIAFLFISNSIKSRFSRFTIVRLYPPVLFLVVFLTLFSWLFHWGEQGVVILGNAESGLAPPKIPSVPTSSLGAYIGDAVAISVMGFIETMAVCKNYAAKHGYSISPNRELVALGLSNVVGGLFGSFGGFGSLPRSRVNDVAGAKTPVAIFIASCLVIVAAAALVPLFHHFPKAGAGSIVFMAAVGLIEVEDVHFLFKMRAWRDMFFMFITFAATIAFGLLYGVIVAASLSLLLLVQRTTAPRMAILGKVEGKQSMVNIDHHSDAKPVEGVLAIKVEEPLHFANTAQMKDILRRFHLYGSLHVHPSELQNPRSIGTVIFDLGNMPDIDTSAVQIMEEIVVDYHKQDVVVILVDLNAKNRDIFYRAGILDMVKGDGVFPTIQAALAYIQSNVSSPVGSPVVDLLESV